MSTSHSHQSSSKYASKFSMASLVYCFKKLHMYLKPCDTLQEQAQCCYPLQESLHQIFKTEKENLKY